MHGFGRPNTYNLSNNFIGKYFTNLTFKLNTCLEDDVRCSLSASGTPQSVLARRAREQLAPFLGPQRAELSNGSPRPSVLQGKL